MSSQAKTVMWIGLFLIGMNVVIHWPQIRAVLFTGSSGGPQSSNPGKPGYRLPGLPWWMQLIQKPQQPPQQQPAGGGVTLV